MRWSALLAALLIATLGLAPAIGFAASDGRVHHQPERGWRTVPSTPAAPAMPGAVPLVERLDGTETALALPLVVRVPFIPPRG